MDAMHLYAFGFNWLLCIYSFNNRHSKQVWLEHISFWSANDKTAVEHKFIIRGWSFLEEKHFLYFFNPCQMNLSNNEASITK